jgi:quercetin dioxygenase-like cupin family protein
MHTDERGEIMDLHVTEKYSVTLVTLQKDLVLKGSLTVSLNGKEEEVIEGDWIVIPAGTKHAYKAIENAELLSICFGKRIGDNYEKDTFRLTPDEKLL